MLVGALLDAELPIEYLRQELGKLDVKNFSLSAQKVLKGNIASTKFDVTPGHEHAHRHLHDIEKILRESDLSDRVKEMAVLIFRRAGRSRSIGAWYYPGKNSLSRSRSDRFHC